MAGRASISAKCIVSSLVIYAEITLVWTLYCAVLLCNVEFRWKIILLFVYMLNLWLHMQNPHYRSYRAGTRNMMLTFDSRPIYRALTYIAVPFLGPQQPRYIGLTLYNRPCFSSLRWTVSTLVQKMAWRLEGAKPLSEPMLAYYQLDPKDHICQWNFIWNSNIFIQGNAI